MAMRGRWSKLCWPRSRLLCGMFVALWVYLLLSLMLLNRDLAKSDDREQIRDKILGLSKQYVKSVAGEGGGLGGRGLANANEADGLQKSLAVLIDNLVERVDYLENKVQALSVVRQGHSAVRPTGSNSSRFAAAGGYGHSSEGREESSYSHVSKAPREGLGPREVKGEQRQGLEKDEKMKTMDDDSKAKCSYTKEELINYPSCEKKAAWMRQFWEIDKCYGHRGVDGTDCSFYIYLSEVEKWCPRFSWRPKETKASKKQSGPLAMVRKSREGLFEMMDTPEKFRWMKMRISRMWSTLWIPAVESLEARGELANRTQKRILIHLGLLTKESGFKIAEKAFSGGPLGELVQWTDIITSLYVLGHNISLSYSTHRLTTFLRSRGLARSSCPSDVNMPFDVIYIDIVGLKQMKKISGGVFNQFKCMLRVIDSFGTEPAYNADHFSKMSGHRSSWGKWNLVPQQFMTMFPHTPDNSFMGFVVEHYPSKVSNTFSTRGLQALVYGKDHTMWKEAESYLNVIHEKFEIHGTVFYNETNPPKGFKIPFYVHNHGIVNGSAIQTLLQESKLFIGLGFPYEGPAPLEAIANGCIFLNPSFNPPKNSKNTKFFQGKPTERSFSSQHPYVEQFIGRPHVWTVDIEDKVELQSVINEISNMGTVEPYLPYEYTCEGMLQRVSAYMQHQEYCSKVAPQWPPVSALQIIPADDKVSCKKACMDLGLVCEPSFFPLLNERTLIEEHFSTSCSAEETIEDIYPPSLKTGRFRNKCQLQKETLLYSCAGEKAGTRRLCPCRDFIKGQVALCKDCL